MSNLVDVFLALISLSQQVSVDTNLPLFVPEIQQRAVVSGSAVLDEV